MVHILCNNSLIRLHYWATKMELTGRKVTFSLRSWIIFNQSHSLHSASRVQGHCVFGRLLVIRLAL